MNKMVVLGSFLSGLVMVAGNSSAQAVTGTLKKIQERGEITLGTREAALPFSYYDDEHRPIGYSIDLCLKVVDAVKAQLKMPNLKVTMVQVASSSRIPLIANGTIDLECGTTSNTAERQKQVGFSVTTFVAGTKFVSKKANNLKDLNALKDKPVVATAGSSNIRQISELNATKNIGMRIASSKDFAEGFLMVETNRASAFFLDDVTLAGLAAGSKSPAEFVISNEALSVEPYALMMRKDDPEFKKTVDAALIATFKSGEINRIYHKWFQTPVPPKGINMGLPMSAPLLKVVAHPTDSPDPAAY
ncbi:MAG: amino acid ABC transporter substrate-binding protein [Pseudomonadota bacterium]